MAATRVQKVIEKHETMKREKAFWLPLWELLGEFIMYRKKHFVSSVIQGEIQNANVFDSTATDANHLMASALIGALWPNAAKSFQIIPPFELEDQITPEIKAWYIFVTKRMATFMDDSRCNFMTALEEYMLDQGCFGISGIASFEQDDDEVPLIFKAVDAKVMAIDEAFNGFVDTVYIEKEYTIRQAVQEYGLDALSKTSQDAFNKGSSTQKIKILIAIEPRMERDPFAFGVQNMPFASMHIELNANKILRESGFNENPVKVTRFWKAMGEKYGRSPGMNGLPDILEANALREAIIMATEKQLDPPVSVMDDGTLGGGTIDTSAGAVNVFSVMGRLGNSTQKPIEPIFVVGDMASSMARITELHEIIANHFFKDRLLDFNNETRMTLGEVDKRDDLRGQTLVTIYMRQKSEQFDPQIQRAFNVYRRRGFLGVVSGSVQDLELQSKGITPTYIPDAVAALMKAGKDFYQIRYISPAARIMQREELQGMQTVLNMAVPLAQADPTILDNIDFDFTFDRATELTGAPEQMVNDLMTVQKIRQNRQAQQEATAKLEADKQQSEIARNVAQVGATQSAKGKAFS